MVRWVDAIQFIVFFLPFYIPSWKLAVGGKVISSELAPRRPGFATRLALEQVT